MKGVTLLLALVLAGGPAAAQRVVRIPPSLPRGAVPPEVPLTAADPDFPVRVHLLTARWGGEGDVYHGYGSGNLLDAKGAQGFDYGFQCDVPFVANAGLDETYQARWKGPYKLEILTVAVGKAQSHPHACTLRLAFEQQPFEPENTAALTHGVSSSLRKRWQDPDFAFEDPQQDYPVRFHVVDGQREEDIEGDHGWGTANLVEPAAQMDVEGAEFTYSCTYGFLTNSQLSGYYQARWITQGSKLEVLLQRPGSDKVDRCTVAVDLKPQPYPESRRMQRTAEAEPAPAFATPVAGTP